MITIIVIASAIVYITIGTVMHGVLDSLRIPREAGSRQPLPIYVIFWPICLFFLLITGFFNHEKSPILILYVLSARISEHMSSSAEQRKEKKQKRKEKSEEVERSSPKNLQINSLEDFRVVQDKLTAAIGYLNNSPTTEG